MFAEASRVNIEKNSESHLDVHPGGARVTTVRPSVQQPVRPDTRASADTHVLTPAVGLPSLQAGGTTLSPCKCPGLGLPCAQEPTSSAFCPYYVPSYGLPIYSAEDSWGFWILWVRVFFIRQSFFKNCLSSLLSILSFWDSDLV